MLSPQRMIDFCFGLSTAVVGLMFLTAPQAECSLAANAHYAIAEVGLSALAFIAGRVSVYIERARG
jgi:hypothetical protein